jgi:hypothetical protein
VRVSGGRARASGRAARCPAGRGSGRRPSRPGSWPRLWTRRGRSSPSPRRRRTAPADPTACPRARRLLSRRCRRSRPSPPRRQGRRAGRVGSAARARVIASRDELDRAAVSSSAVSSRSAGSARSAGTARLARPALPPAAAVPAVTARAPPRHQRDRGVRQRQEVDAVEVQHLLEIQEHALDSPAAGIQDERLLGAQAGWGQPVGEDLIPAAPATPADVAQGLGGGRDPGAGADQPIFQQAPLGPPLAEALQLPRAQLCVAPDDAPALVLVQGLEDGGRPHSRSPSTSVSRASRSRAARARVSSLAAASGSNTRARHSPRPRS